MAQDSGTERQAPGRLALVQSFLNAATEDPGPEGLALGEAIRLAHREGEAQWAIAARYGISQQLVSAAIRGRRLTGPPDATLATPRSAGNWLAVHGVGTGQPLGARTHSTLLELHAALLALALENAGGPVTSDAVAVLNGVAGGVPCILQFGESCRPIVVPVDNDADGFAGDILGRVYEAQHNGTWERLKACPADRCKHVFYDTSRNRTATWCSMAICGNRAKVRNYQQRRRAMETG